MGLLSKISDWMSSASGGGREKKLQKAITQLKLLNMRLTKQANIQNQRGQLARRKAIELRKKGDIEASKVQMKASLQSQAWNTSIENFRLRLEELQFKLESTKAVKDMAGILVNVASTIQGLAHSVSMPDMTKALEDIDLGISDFDVVQEVASEGMEQLGTTDQISDEAVENALQEVDAEIRVETDNALPSAGKSAISELERELQGLKQGEQSAPIRKGPSRAKPPPEQKGSVDQKPPPPPEQK